MSSKTSISVSRQQPSQVDRTECQLEIYTRPIDFNIGKGLGVGFDDCQHVDDLV
jgi:hypothetical protein